MPENSDLYCTLAEADEYFSRRGDQEWAEADEPARLAALHKATEFIDTSFRWIGSVASTSQRLSWPRRSARDLEGRLRPSDEIPPEVRDATAWLAKEALSGELDPPADRGGEISAIAAGSVSIQYADTAASGKTFRHVKRLLRNLIRDDILRRGS